LLRGKRTSLLREPPPRREAEPLTVCIAAVCDGTTVVGASDRMITWGDVQFEPSTMKAYGLTTSIAVMMSGDAALHSEVLNRVRVEMGSRIEADRERWLTVQEVAEAFVAERNAVKLERAERALLQPFGLTMESFTHGLHGLGADLTKAVAGDIVNFAMPSSAWIVCGIDATGPHIYSVIDGMLSCNDQIGFAAIGIGARHAESQLMLAEQGHSRSLAQTLLMVYTAKKRAEVAPGVGGGTDMFTAGAGLGSLQLVPDAMRDRIDAEYKRLRDTERRAIETAKVEMEVYVERLIQAQTATQVADGNTLADEDNGSDDLSPEDLDEFDEEFDDGDDRAA
jgi:hypothetical protein